MKHFEINDGQEIIKMGFDEYDEFEHLSINYPITFLWRDYYYEDSDEINISLLPIKDDNIFKLLNDSINIDFNSDYTDDEDYLVQSLKPFLSLFKNGKYSLNFFNQQKNPTDAVFFERLIFENIKKSNDNFDVDFSNGKIKIPNKKRDIYTINKYNFIPIKSKSEIDWERVHFFENQIKEGEKPFIIVFSGEYNEEYFCSYILDGHHKMLAYQNLGINPPFVSISYFPENSFEIKFDIEYISQNFYLQTLYEIFQEWENKRIFLMQNPNSNLQKYVKNGKFCFYNSNTKTSEGDYIDDLPDGEHRSFFPNGKIKSLRNYKKGLSVGEWLNYDKEGLLTHEHIYNNFHKQTSSKFFYDGKQMHENIWNYDLNGNLIFHKFFDEFDNISNETYYEDNIPVIQKSFERDGEIKLLEKFDNTQKRLVSIPLNENLILEYSTEKYKDQKRRIKAWYEKDEVRIEKFKGNEELRKKLDDSIETQNFTSKIKIILFLIILIIFIFKVLLN